MNQNQTTATAMNSHSEGTTADIRYIIGIDCGTNTGYAIWNCLIKELIMVTTMSAHEAWNHVRYLKKTYGADALFLRYEDAHQREWLPRNAGPERLQGAGSIKRDSTLWKEFCELEGIAYEAVAPKKNRTKLSSAAFKMMTKWQSSTNEHGRDAAMMVYLYRIQPHILKYAKEKSNLEK